MDGREVYMVKFGRQEMQILDQLPNHNNRCFTVQSLLEAFGLLSQCKTVRPVMASKKFLNLFHDTCYLDLLENISMEIGRGDASEDDVIDRYWTELESFGLIDDALPFRGVWDYCKLIAGCSLACSTALITLVKNCNSKINLLEPKNFTNINQNNLLNDDSKLPDINAGTDTIAANQFVVVNWMGGRHHAKKAEASGFCYINDVVLAVINLCTYFPKVMTIDVDVHHGDGIEEAFAYSDKVYCISFHIRQPGFFPGTGSVDDVGYGPGKYYTANVPLNYGVTDEQFVELFDAIVLTAIQRFQPKAIVLICGADCLNGDPLGGMCLTYQAIVTCIQKLLSSKIPLLVFGGGGYHLPSVSRLYSLSTAMLLNTLPLPEYIPAHSVSYSDFRTQYINTQRACNLNSSDYICLIKKKLLNKIQKISK